MTFSAQKLEDILKYIESKLEFESDDLKSSLSYNIYCSVDIDEYLKVMCKNDQDQYKYCLAVLQKIGCIDISNGVIIEVTPKGYKFMFKYLYNIDF